MPLSNDKNTSPVIGRFAPSPTGSLHLGSLFTAIASYLSAKAAGGLWLVRIEDTDLERCSQAHSDAILYTLDAFGLHWDGAVRYQSQYLNVYDTALELLKNAQLVFGCACSRKSLSLYAKKYGLADSIYPNLCNDKQLDFADRNIRVKLSSDMFCFDDLLQEKLCLRPSQSFGCPIIKRRNGIYNYVFTSLIDDAIQGVNQIVRGMDLYQLTIAQLSLAQSLAQYMDLAGCFTQSVRFAHLPILVNPELQKLSKQSKAEPIAVTNIPGQINQVLSLLGQPMVTPDKPQNMLAEATSQWNLRPLKLVKSIMI